jgi:hypothetical protein
MGLVLLLALVVSSCRKTGDPATGQAGGSPAGDAAVIRALVTAEETYLALGPKMSALSKGLLHLQLPGPGAESLFSPSVVVTDLGPPPALTATDLNTLAARAWPVEPNAANTPKLDLWRPLLDGVSWFEHAKVYIIDGEHPGGDPDRYEATGGFEALASMKTGEWRSFHGALNLTWQRMKTGADSTESEWQITSWRTREMHMNASPKRLFVEALESVLRSPQDVARLRRSEHYEATLKYYREGMKSPPHPYFAPISANQKEGVTVADIDSDGFDDIYISVRIGKNMLLRNRGDGTFVEAAALHGLDLPGHTTCSLFADFDNDGDLDALLGRSLLKVAYLENVGGWFNQHRAPAHFPMAVISMSAADYNRDGLLDVYVCTYRPAAPVGASPAGGVARAKDDGFDWPDEFFPPDLAKEYKRRLAAHNQGSGKDQGFPNVLDQLGPPNVLLVNRGAGRLEVAPESDSVSLWRNSLQATWGDYDQDGDPDLYVANDWAADNLLRNDGAAGFKDVTAEAGIGAYGFAMGASWGDYDNDGREDLYVSNMYSKAGRRITAKLPGISRQYVESAMGNWMYRQGPDGRFQQVAGMQLPAMTVMKAGWSWGGCFADFDNDAFLDLYVLSGYFTAPKELSSELDL